jgi:hypothetical protein
LANNNLNSQHSLIIKKLDEKNQVHQVSLCDTAEYFAVNRAKVGRDMINETIKLYHETQTMQKQVAEDYIEIEKQFLEQEKHLENLKNMKNSKEKNLMKSGILF